jgi:DNA-binding beta-propeller fold protein YncE
VIDVYDLERREIVTSLPCDGPGVTQGYTFFSPDSRFLVLTRSYWETVLVGEIEERRTMYTTQIIEIPSCRVVYENTFPGYPSMDGSTDSQALPNYDNVFHSEIPEYLFARDGSRVILPVATQTIGVFDLTREEMLFTWRYSPPRFASFSLSGKSILTVSRTGKFIYLLDAETGGQIAKLGFTTASGISFLRGFAFPGDDKILLAGSGYCGVYELRLPDGSPDINQYFPDGSGRYIQAAAGVNAAVIDGRGQSPPVVLEDSGEYTNVQKFKTAGDVVVGLSETGYPSYLALWDAVTGKKSDIEFPDPEHYMKTPPFFLAADGSRLGVIYQMTGIVSASFRVFDTKTGELFAENKLGWSNEAVIAFDRELTKLLFIWGNVVSVFDALTGEELFVLDDYPSGQQALGSWSGQKAAISDDGTLIAVAHSKKGTLEIIDAQTGSRLHEIPLGGAATTAPSFSHSGELATIGAGKYLISVDTKTGRVLFSVYQESGFSAGYAYAEDDRYLIGADIRDAKTGEVACSVRLAAQPVWEISGTAGTTIPLGQAHAIYLPSLEETLADLRTVIREYTFTPADKLRFALD